MVVFGAPAYVDGHQGDVGHHDRDGHRGDVGHHDRDARRDVSVHVIPDNTAHIVQVQLIRGSTSDMIVM